MSVNKLKMVVLYHNSTYLMDGISLIFPPCIGYKNRIKRVVKNEKMNNFELQL